MGTSCSLLDQWTSLTKTGATALSSFMLSLLVDYDDDSDSDNDKNNVGGGDGGS